MAQSRQGSSKHHTHGENKTACKPPCAERCKHVCTLAHLYVVHLPPKIETRCVEGLTCTKQRIKREWYAILACTHCRSLPRHATNAAWSGMLPCARHAECLV